MIPDSVLPVGSEKAVFTCLRCGLRVPKKSMRAAVIARNKHNRETKHNLSSVMACAGVQVKVSQ